LREDNFIIRHAPGFFNLLHLFAAFLAQKLLTSDTSDDKINKKFIKKAMTKNGLAGNITESRHLV